MRYKLIQSFNKFQNKLFIIGQNEKITFKEFYEESLKIIDHFKTIGLRENDKILIILDNSSQYLKILNACILGGFVACPIDPTTKKNTIKKIKKTFNIKYVVNKKINIRKKNYNIKNLCTINSDCLTIPSSDNAGEIIGILFDTNSIIKSAISFSKLSNYNRKSKILHCLPMFYMAGILDTFFSAIVSGSTIILNPKFSMMNALSFWNLSMKYKANILFLNPTIFFMICSIFRKPARKLISHLKDYKLIVSTGSKLNKSIRNNFFKIFKKKISVCYGATELGGPISLQTDSKCFKFDGGKVGENTKIKIKRKNKKNYIFVKNPFLMKGYLQNKKLSKVILDNGFFPINDLGIFKKKILRIDGTDRSIIKRGGELIHLKHIENISMSSNQLVSAKAYGKDDIIAGTELFLEVKFKKKKKNSLSKFINFLNTNLRQIEIPKKIYNL